MFRFFVLIMCIGTALGVSDEVAISTFFLFIFLFLFLYFNMYIYLYTNINIII